ncbi:hypothetical protein D3C72_1425240 [compost metagenome]
MPVKARRTAADACAGVRPCTGTEPAKGMGTAPLRSTTSGGRDWLPGVMLPSKLGPPKRLRPGSKMLMARVSPTPMMSVGASLDARARVLKDRAGAAFSRSLAAKSRSSRA